MVSEVFSNLDDSTVLCCCCTAWHPGQGQLEPGCSVGSLEGHDRREQSARLWDSGTANALGVRMGPWHLCLHPVSVVPCFVLRQCSGLLTSCSILRLPCCRSVCLPKLPPCCAGNGSALMLPWEMESCDHGVDAGLAHGATAAGKDSPAPCRAAVTGDLCAVRGDSPHDPALPLGQSSPGVLPSPWASVETRSLTGARQPLLGGRSWCFFTASDPSS